MNRADVIALLSLLKVTDVRGFVVIDDATIEGWRYVMNREPSIAVAYAMQTAQNLIATPGATFPTPGDFRALVAETASGLPSVADARKQVERCLKENYPGMPAKYTPDRIVLLAMREIGAPAVFRGAQREEQTAALWRQFDQAYRRLRDERVTTPAALRDPSAKELAG